MNSKTILCLSLAAALLAGCAKKQPDSTAAAKDTPAAGQAAAAAPEAGPMAPDFELKTTTGSTLQFSSLRGKVVLVDFWATWCGPCKAEIPHLVALYGKYKDKGLEIVGIADDSNEHDAVGPFVTHNNIPYPVVYGEPEVGQGYGGISGYPTLFVVDKQGHVVQKFYGYTDERDIELVIQKLL